MGNTHSFSSASLHPSFGYHKANSSKTANLFSIWGNSPGGFKKKSTNPQNLTHNRIATLWYIGLQKTRTASAKAWFLFIKPYSYKKENRQ